MTRKQGGGRDTRQDPELDDEPSSNNRVDRVYAPAMGRSRETNPATAAAIANRRSRTPTGTGGGMVADAEIALRRQLSTLQRQLADAQRAIADKDDEVAAEVEKRLAVSAAYETLVDEQAAQQAQLEDLTAYQTRTLAVEQRLLDTVTTAEEHARARDREKDGREKAESRVGELTAALEDAYKAWKTERAQLEEQHASEITKLETQKRMASDAAGAALLATTTRMRDSHEEELTQLRDSNEKSLAMLRGELEPKALEALSLAEERQRLVDELAALRTETSRTAAEREEAVQREFTQMGEQHAAEISQQQRQAIVEIQRITDERDAQTQALQQAQRGAEAREAHFEQTAAEAAETRGRLERELAEAKSAGDRLVAEKTAVEDKLAAAQAQIDQLTDQKRSLRDRLEISEGEARRNALDRRHFISYLEEGLAMLRDAEDPDVTITPGDPGDDDEILTASAAGALAEEPEHTAAEAAPHETHDSASGPAPSGAS